MLQFYPSSSQWKLSVAGAQCNQLRCFGEPSNICKQFIDIDTSTFKHITPLKWSLSTIILSCGNDKPLSALGGRHRGG